jgi:hypothetical protein
LAARGTGAAGHEGLSHWHAGDNIANRERESFSANYPDLYRRAATYVDKIFKGIKPSDLPIEQPTKVDRQGPRP